MSAVTADAPVTTRSRTRDWSDPVFQSFVLLRIGFFAAPLIAGIDKFFNQLVYWPKYLASWYDSILPGSAQAGMHMIGVVEIAAALIVLVKPRIGAYVVAAWLAGIVLDLLTYSGYYDIALRDFGLMLGALTLGRLATKFD